MADTVIAAGEAETAPLLHPAADGTVKTDRTHLKGSIAGVYSLGGGAGILILTKVGGVLFDSAREGAPFFLLAGFNGLLLLGVVGVAVARLVRKDVDQALYQVDEEEQEVMDDQEEEDEDTITEV